MALINGKSFDDFTQDLAEDALELARLDEDDDEGIREAAEGLKKQVSTLLRWVDGA